MQRYEPDHELREWIDQAAKWTFVYRGEHVPVLVRILDARRLFGRIDLLVETNAGGRVWASSESVEILDAKG